jgi:hypothetical protein
MQETLKEDLSGQIQDLTAEQEEIEVLFRMLNADDGTPLDSMPQSVQGVFDQEPIQASIELAEGSAENVRSSIEAALQGIEITPSVKLSGGPGIWGAGSPEDLSSAGGVK